MAEFDTRTHIFDPKTGKLLKYQPYRLEVSKENGTIFYRDGIAYNPDGSPKEKPIMPSVLKESKRNGNQE